MNSKIKGLMAVVLGSALIISGCGGKKDVAKNTPIVEDSNVTAPGELPVVKSQVKLEIGVPTTTVIENYDTNAYTKFIEEKTGVDLVFNEIVNPSQKLKVMLAANDKIPGVLIGVNFADDLLMKYGKSGMNTIVDMSSYMDKYGYYLNDVLTKAHVDNIEKRLASADGGKYYMPNVREQTGNEYSVKAFINKKWLDKLGLEMPKTTEDLRNVLKEFTTKDPNGNGKNDELGITGCYNSWNSIPWHFFMNSFIYDDYATQMVVDNSGKVSSILFTDEFKEGMKYLNSLYNEGLYDANSFTQGATELGAIMVGDDSRVGVFVGASADTFFSGMPERMADYVALPPLEGPDGVAWAVRTPNTVGKGGYITKYCEHPLAAFRVMDYMLSEEASLFSKYGVEGQDWRWATEKDKGLFESIGQKAKIVSYIPYGATQNSHWAENNPCFRTLEMSDGMAWDGDPYNGEKFKADALSAYYGKAPENLFNPGIYTEEEMEEMSFIKTEIDTHIKQEIASFILGQRSLDEYDKFLNELKGLEYERYVEILQIGYDRVK